MSDRKLRQRLPLVARRIVTSLEMGLPLAKVLSLLIQEERDPWYRSRLAVVHDQLARGVDVVTALHPMLPLRTQHLFDGCQLGGAVSVYLTRVSEWMAWHEQERAACLQALWYPLVLLVMVGVMGWVMIWVTIPQVAMMLPHPTGGLLFMLKASSWMQTLPGMVTLLVGVLLGILVVVQVGRWWVGWGGSANRAEQLWVLGVQLAMGVPLNQSLMRVGQPRGASNGWAEGVAYCRQSGQLADGLGMFLQLGVFHRERLRHGERTGQLATAVLDVAGELRDARRMQLHTRFRLVRPVLLTLVGLMMAACMGLTLWPMSAMIQSFS